MKLILSIFVLLISLNSFALTKIKLGLNWKPEPEFGGFYAAQINKTYKKYGLDVEIIEGGANIPIAQMVASGKFEFGISAGDHVILSHTRGANLVAIFSVYQKSPECLMVREESGIKNIQELMKSDHILSLGSGQPYVTYFQKKYAPTKAKVVPYGGGVSAYVGNKKLAQQCYAGSEPQLAEKQGVKTRTLLVADEGFDNYPTVLVTRKEYLDKHSDVAKKLVLAVREGWREYLKNPGPTHKLIEKLNPTMDQATQEVVLKEQRSLMLGKLKAQDPFGHMSSSRWKTLVQQMKEIGLIKKSIPTDQLYKNF